MHVDQYHETIRACRMCLMCRHACTVGNVTQRDTNLPRGKALLLYAEQVDLLDWDDRAVQVLYECTTCHLCREWCVTGYDIAPVAQAARADLVEKGLAPQGALEIRRRIEQSGNSYGETESLLAGWLMELNLPQTADLLYFVGCVAAYRRPEIARSAVTLFRRAKADFTILRDEQCCGQPLYTLGFRAEAKAQAERTVASILATGARTVVSSCPTGVDAFRHTYREWGVELPEGVRFLHMAEYLAEEIEAGRLHPSRAVESSVTYHDSCALGRELQVFDAPRRVLAALPGVQLRELRLNRAHAPCCGGGGGLPATNPVMAAGAAKNAGEIVLETGADILVTACPSCKESLSHHLPGTEVLDIAELVERAL